MSFPDAMAATGVIDVDGSGAPARPHGWRPIARHVAVLGLLAVSANVVLPQITRAGAAVPAIGQFQWRWVPAIVLASACTYAMAALSLMAAAGARLSFLKTLAAQIAAAFGNRLLPAGAGAMATNVRYLECKGIVRSRAIGAVGLDSVAGFVVHAAGVLLIVALFRQTHARFHVHGPDLPDTWPILVGVVGTLLVAGVVTAAVRLRGRGRVALSRALSQLTELGRDRGRAARLLGASAGVTAAYAAALCAAVQAAGGGSSIVSIIAVYMGGSAVGAVAPTPGGLGAVEAGLIAGLTSVGQPAAAAVTAVLVFRLVTYWLPVLPGGVAFWTLRRSHAL